MTAAIPTSVGVFHATFTGRGLASLDFPGASRREDAAHQTKPDAEQEAWLRHTEAALRAAMKGEPVGQLPPLDLSRGTPFQREVWLAMSRIPLGETRSYSELARQIGRPRAVRAVGQACGANPLPVLIPCHRVLASGGALGGYSGGLAWKRRLLRSEGHPVADDR